MSQAVLGKRLFQVIGLAGSLRKESYNRQLMLAAQHMAPKEICLHIADLREIPLYDGDIELEGIPAAVVTLKAHVREADALLIATPEYNGFMPGVLHNVLDWLSRPRATTPLAKKMIFLVGATPGQRGTRSAQEHLRQLLSNIQAVPQEEPMLHLSRADQMFIAPGIANFELQERLRQYWDVVLERLRAKQTSGEAA